MTTKPNPIHEPTAEERESLARAHRFKAHCQRLCVSGIVAIRTKGENHEAGIRQAKEHLVAAVEELFDEQQARVFLGELSS